MTEIIPFFHKNKEIIQINDFNNYTESASENDYENFPPVESFESLNSLESSLPESPNKKFPNFPVKSIFYPELFLNQSNLSKYICGLWENVCDEAVTPGCKCGNLFCKKCLNFYYDNEKKKCPKCKYGGGEVVRSELIDRYIASQKMKCENYVNDCTWEGECKNYKEHKEIKCPEEIINCPNKKHGCVIKMKRKKILEHLGLCDYKKIFCEKCGNEILKEEENKHKKICPKEKIECPFGCDNIFERCELDTHKLKCDYYTIKCPFSCLGCKDEIRKKEENKKLNEDCNKHLLLVMENIVNLKKNFDECQQKFKKMEEDIQSLKNNAYNNNYNRINIYNNDIDNYMYSYISAHKSRFSDSNFKPLSHKRKSSSYERINSDNKNDDNDNNYIDDSVNNNLKMNLIDSNNTEENNMPLEEKMNITKGRENNIEIYDLIGTTKNLFNINKSIIEGIYLNGKNKHFYIFFNKKYDIP